MSTITLKGATLAEIAAAIETAPAKERAAVKLEALAVLKARSEAAKPGSYKQRRTDIAIAQIKAGAGVDPVAAFEGAKATPQAKPATKPAAKAKSKARGKTRVPADVAAALAELSPEQKAGVMALLGS